MKKQIISIAIAMALIQPIEAARPTFGQLVTQACVNAVKDCLLAYTICAASTLAHECGHALSSKVFYGEYGEIGLFGRPTDPDYITIPWVNIKFKSFNVFRGAYCTVKGNLTTKSGLIKNMIGSAAGPVCGMLASLISLKLVSEYTSNDYSLSRLTCYYAGANNMFNLVPNGTDNDGQQFIDSYKKYRSFKEALAEQKAKQA